MGQILQFVLNKGVVKNIKTDQILQLVFNI